MEDTQTPSWKTIADARREAILNSIPNRWRLEKLPSNEEQIDVTGAYIQQFLSPQEVKITETDVVGIAKATSTGSWSAVDVVEAFCHRAALAHQLVGHTFYLLNIIPCAEERSRCNDVGRLIVLYPGELSS